MSLRLVTPVATLPVTVAQAKANGRIDVTEEDALIEGLIQAALAWVERYTGVAFEQQTWEVVLDAFPAGEIELPLGKVTSVTSVKYADEAGDEQTVDPANYVVDLASRDAWVVPVSGFSWPATMSTVNAVTVRFVAGSGATADVKQAVLLLVEHWYENRASASERDAKSIPLGVEAILGLHRRMFV